MRKSEITSLIRESDQIDGQNIPQLEKLVEDFPFFTSAQLLLTKAYQLSEDLKFEDQLRLSAAYAGDRTKLHQLIHSIPSQAATEEVENKAQVWSGIGHEGSSSTNKDQEESPEKTPQDEEQAFLDSQIMTAAINSSIMQEVGDNDELEIPDQIGTEHEISTAENDFPQKEKSSEFDEATEHSFGDWLKHFGDQAESNDLPEEKSHIIQSISDQAKSIQEKAEFFSASKMAKLSVQESDDLMTETLAKVYEAQGKYEKAIQAYEKLQLKFPEKRVYFAGRIKAANEKLKN